MPRLASIAVDKAAMSYDRLFTYLVPDSLAGRARPGCRVLVPFGQGNRKRQGIIFSLEEGESTRGIKPILQLLDEEPVLTGELLRLAAHLHASTFCTFYDAVRLMVPAGMDHRVAVSYALAPEAPDTEEGLGQVEAEVVRYLRKRKKPVAEKKLMQEIPLLEAGTLVSLYEKGVLVREEDLHRRVLDEKVTMVRLLPDDGLTRLTQKQKAVAAFLQQEETASLKEVCYYSAVTRVVVDNMQKHGLVEYFEREVYRNPYRDAVREAGREIILSSTQKEALDELLRIQEAGEYAVSLLYGVTGSGKTQVFLKLAQEVVRQGQGVIVLVPEISLTPQTVNQFHLVFGGDVAVIHSGLSLGERMDEYKRIRRGEAKVVVGTRSAVFAPIEKLGLIIIDEEQEPSYKSEKNPRFHAREVAKWRVHEHHTQLVLASATPSVESFHWAREGRYHLIPLKGRYTGSSLPDVTMVDLGEDPPVVGSSLISGQLCEELYHNLQMGEQSILLLNRRGYHTLVRCTSCGEPAKCPNCSVALTYHTANNALCCHYCGYVEPKGARCPCGGEYARFQGAGTQRVEEELQTLFPEARILRMDMDTTMQRFSHERLFGQFARHEYDIMVGTQMVAKGLNFPDVTLVGVLCADQSLYSDDFRSFERTFSLITQVVGRAGRSLKKGRAFIQTYSPENPVLRLAAAQQYQSFFEGEITLRRLGLYPPFCDLCALGITGEGEEGVREGAALALRLLRETAAAAFADLPLRVLGPSEFAVYRMNGKYRRKLLLKCRNNVRFREFLRQVLAAFEQQRRDKGVHIFADMYYDSF